MTHRGPNDRGTVPGAGVAFGARRLSIVDVEAGHQPFANETGDVWGMQNGELYNHDEIRARARAPTGTCFAARCDTEILPHLYEAHGDAHRRAAARQVRDRRLGRARGAAPSSPATGSASSRSTGPQAGDLVVFASELKSLLASRPDRRRARLRGDRRLPDASASSPARARRSRAFSKLLPGHRLVVDARRRAATSAYWTLSRARARRTGAALRRVGRGAARAARGRRPLAPDERRAARRDAQRRPRLEPDRRADGAQHERAGQDVLGRLRARTATRTSSPTRGSSRTRSAPTTTSSSCRSPTRPSTSSSSSGSSTSRSPTSPRSASPRSRELAAQHVTVALSGQGADELFGGYAKHRPRPPPPRSAAAARPGARAGHGRRRCAARRASRRDRPHARRARTRSTACWR